MKQAARRWTRRLLLLGACAGLLAAVVHSSWVRGLVLRQMTSRFSAASSFVYSASALDYNLFRLTASVDGLQISRRGSTAAPLLRVRHLEAALSRRVLAGVLEVDRLDADGVALVIDLSARAGAPAGKEAPFKVPLFTVGHALLRHANIEVLDPGGLGHFKAADVTLELEGGGPRRLAGPFTVAGGLSLDNEDTRARVDRLEGRAFLDGDAIGVQLASAMVGPQRLLLDGSVTFTGPSPRFDLGIAGAIDVAKVVSWFPALPAGSGPLQLTGRVTGPLTDPQFKYSAQSTGVLLPDIHVPASIAEGTISRAGINVSRLRTGLGKGWVEAIGRLPLGPADPNSRFSLKWADVSIASLAQVFPLLPADPIGMVATGAAEVQWPGMALEFATVSGAVTSALRFAPALPPARVSVDASPGRWMLRGVQELEGGTLASIDATITVSPADVTRSQVLGTLRVSSAHLQPAMAEARRAFPGLTDVSAWLIDAPLSIDGAIDGTLGAPRLSGLAVSDELRLRDLPSVSASATFVATPSRLDVLKAAGGDGTGNRVEGSAAIDFDARTTTGTFAADVGNPEPVLAALLGTAGPNAAEAVLKAGGSVTLAGKWNGPVADPVVSVTVGGTDVSLASSTFQIERGTVEGRLNGPVSSPEATLSITAGAVRAASLAPVPAEAQLSLTSGRLEVTAKVPDWSASLTGHASVQAPREFAATVAIADLAAERLAKLAGGQHSEQVAGGAVSATLEAGGSFDGRRLRLTGHASVAGAELGAGEHPFVDGLKATVDVRDGRLWLTRLDARGFGGPLSASGDLPLSWVEEYLPEGWRVDDAPAPSKPASFELRAEPDVKTLGAWLRPDEPGTMTGSLRLFVSGTASAPSLDAIDGSIILEPDTVTVRDVPFTLPRAAEVRITDGRAIVENIELTAPGTAASVSGSLGLTGERVLDADVSASGALGFLSSLIPGRLAGTFKGSYRATGPVADPSVTGRLSLEDAAWVWQEQRVALRDWSGEAVLSAEALTIGRLEGQVNGGDASVSGSVQFGGQGGAGLTMRVRDAFVEVVKGFRSQADAELTLTSAAEGARLSGKVTVTSGAYREPITAMARLFSAPRTRAAAPAGESSTLDGVSLDVELTASSPIIIENSAGRLDLVPNMKLRGTVAEPVFFGTLDMVDDGRLTLRGRTFRLSEARVVFAGAGDPAVQLVGETRVGDYDVTLRTQGPVTNMEATYTSDPPLSQRDLQSLLITGRITDSASTKSRDDEQFVLGTASSDLLGVAGQMVGLDSVQLGRGDFELGSSDVNPAMRLTLSKTISARSRLVLSQNLDDNKLTWIVVYVPKRGYEVRLSQRDNLEEVIEFRQEISFGPGVSPPSISGLRKRVKGPRVSSVEFTGDLGFPASELESVIKLRPSKEFDAGRWQEDRERLEAFYRDRGYAVARIAQNRTFARGAGGDQAALMYRIDRGPRTLLVVEGIDLDDKERSSLMAAWSGSVLPEFLQQDIERQLRSLLASHGRLRPSIKVAVDTLNPDVVRASVTGDAGPATQVRRLVFEGTAAVGEADLRAELQDRVDLDSAWVDPAPLVDAVKMIYAERGRPATRVFADPPVFDGDAAELRVRVTEAPAAILEDIILAGVAKERADAARAAIGIRPGDAVLLESEADARRQLERFYLDQGFRSAKIASTQTSDAEGRVTMGFAVSEGPVSVVAGVTLEGLQATNEAFASGAVTLKPGEPAGQQDAADTQKRLYGLGVFRSAEVSFEPAPAAAPAAEGTVPVNVKVSLEEARRFQLRYGVQLSNEYGPVFEDFTSAFGVAADIRDRNFLGRAFGLGASGRLEKNLASLRGQFSLPPLLGQRLQTNWFGTIRSETDTSDAAFTYTDKERDITFEQRLGLPHRMEVSWGYSYNLRDVTLMDAARAASAELRGVLASLNGTFIFDARDKPFDASRGWFQSSNVQWGLEALGSDLDYVRVLLRQFYYRPAGPFVLASGVRWGWLHGLADRPDLPPITILDRFFDAGGSQTVRGYAEDSLSAVDVYGVPVGGSKLLLLNQEVRFPLFSKWLQGAAFVDAGNTFKPGTSIKLDELAVGVGVGIRIMTPFAPIRIDVGYPLDRRPQDSSYRFHFSIGQIF